MEGKEAVTVWVLRSLVKIQKQEISSSNVKCNWCCEFTEIETNIT